VGSPKGFLLLDDPFTDRLAVRAFEVLECRFQFVASVLVLLGGDAAARLSAF
jgi:hypothetical protein